MLHAFGIHISGWAACFKAFALEFYSQILNTPQVHNIAINKFQKHSYIRKFIEWDVNTLKHKDILDIQIAIS